MKDEKFDPVKFILTGKPLKSPKEPLYFREREIYTHCNGIFDEVAEAIKNLPGDLAGKYNKLRRIELSGYVAEGYSMRFNCRDNSITNGLSEIRKLITNYYNICVEEDNPWSEFQLWFEPDGLYLFHKKRICLFKRGKAYKLIRLLARKKLNGVARVKKPVSICTLDVTNEHLETLITRIRGKFKEKGSKLAGQEITANPLPVNKGFIELCFDKKNIMGSIENLI